MQIVINARTINSRAVEVTAQKELVSCAGNDLCEKIPEFVQRLYNWFGWRSVDVICGDLNCPGKDSTSIDVQLAMLLQNNCLIQHITLSAMLIDIKTIGCQRKQPMKRKKDDYWIENGNKPSWSATVLHNACHHIHKQ